METKEKYEKLMDIANMAQLQSNAEAFKTVIRFVDTLKETSDANIRRVYKEIKDALEDLAFDAQLADDAMFDKHYNNSTDHSIEGLEVRKNWEKF